MNKDFLELLPAINAIFNSLSFICLIVSWRSIKLGNKVLHRNFVLAAFSFSTLFLAGYLTLHFNIGTTRFPELGLIKTIYLTILITHTILAALLLPLLIVTFYRAYKENFEGHKKIARYAMPIWVYVSFTGVIIYFMLYQWFPAR